MLCRAAGTIFSCKNYAIDPSAVVKFAARLIMKNQAGFQKLSDGSVITRCFYLHFEKSLAYLRLSIRGYPGYDSDLANSELDRYSIPSTVPTHILFAI